MVRSFSRGAPINIVSKKMNMKKKDSSEDYETHNRSTSFLSQADINISYVKNT